MRKPERGLAITSSGEIAWFDIVKELNAHGGRLASLITLLWGVFLFSVSQSPIGKMLDASAVGLLFGTGVDLATCLKVETISSPSRFIPACFPATSADWPQFVVSVMIGLSLVYLVSAFLFVVASLRDPAPLDGYSRDMSLANINAKYDACFVSVASIFSTITLFINAWLIAISSNVTLAISLPTGLLIIAVTLWIFANALQGRRGRDRINWAADQILPVVAARSAAFVIWVRRSVDVVIATALVFVAIQGLPLAIADGLRGAFGLEPWIVVLVYVTAVAALVWLLTSRWTQRRSVRISLAAAAQVPLFGPLLCAIAIIIGRERKRQHTPYWEAGPKSVQNPRNLPSSWWERWYEDRAAVITCWDETEDALWDVIQSPSRL